MTGLIIRPLIAEDLPAYRRARLDGLKDHPEAFGSSWEEEREYSDDTFLSRMRPPPPSVLLGAFRDGTLGGLGSLIIPPRLKMKHVGTIFGVYVAPAFRHAGMARAIMLELLDAAWRAEVVVVQLTVTVGNEGARRLYVDLGFTPFGLARRALRVNNRYVDEEYMALDLG